MAALNVRPSSPIVGLLRLSLSILLLLALTSAASAQSILPSNATIPPPIGGKEIRLYLQGGQPSSFQTVYTIAPLTGSAGLPQSGPSISTWKIQGTITLTTASNVKSISSGVIAYISCDSSANSTSSPIDLISAAAAQRPPIAAILLYSTTSVGCNVTGSPPFDFLYTMTTPADSQTLLGIFPLAHGNSITAEIASDTTTPSRNISTNSNDSGPAPTTAVAMSILYTITGIITLLFIAIIGTGALRAHRNPERYGPRRALGGRPRQSRAKGLARAMLETIPIVKFGDPEPAKPGSRDVELEDGNSAHNVPPVTETDADKDKKVKPEMTAPTVPAPAVGEGMESGLGTAESVKSRDENAPRDGEVECSICTEAFTAGEDVRLLPCQHKYHPACIDPWLLNVSGTCPLCRHDLNPTEELVEGTTPAEGELPPPLTPESQPESDASTGRGRVSRFLDLHGLRTATPHERIAALRRLREESRAEGAAVAPEAHAEQAASGSGSGRHRFMDRFRIGSRSQQPASTATGEAAVTRETPVAAETSQTQTETRDETPRQG